MNYRKELQHNGLAESRTYNLESAMGIMHSALSKLDTANIRLFNQMYPGVSKAVNHYVSFNDGLAVIRED